MHSSPKSGILWQTLMFFWRCTLSPPHSKFETNTCQFEQTTQNNSRNPFGKVMHFVYSNLPLLKVSPTLASNTMSTVMTAHMPFLLNTLRKPGAKHKRPATIAAKPALIGKVELLLYCSSSFSFPYGHNKIPQPHAALDRCSRFFIFILRSSDRVRA